MTSLLKTALHVATNMAKAMGSALVEKVGQSSSYQGSNLQMLAANVMANATAELKKTANLTGEINADAMEILQRGAGQSAESSRTNMETSFKNLEDQGISLSEITEGLAEAGLDSDAMDLVFTQVKNTLVSGGEEMRGAARDIAATAASMANAVLDRGGSLTQVRDTIAAPLAAMAEVGRGQAGLQSGTNSPGRSQQCQHPGDGHAGHGAIQGHVIGRHDFDDRQYGCHRGYPVE